MQHLVADFDIPRLEHGSTPEHHRAAAVRHDRQKFAIRRPRQLAAAAAAALHDGEVFARKQEGVVAAAGAVQHHRPPLHETCDVESAAGAFAAVRILETSEGHPRQQDGNVLQCTTVWQAGAVGARTCVVQMKCTEERKCIENLSGCKTTTRNSTAKDTSQPTAASNWLQGSQAISASPAAPPSAPTLQACL